MLTGDFSGPMLMRLMTILLLLALAPALQAQELVRYGYRIVETYPHNIQSFTQGLLFEDGFLYEGTGKNGLSSLSKIDLDTGDVVQSTPLNQRYFGEGIEHVGNRLFQLTWRSHLVFEYDMSTFEQLDTHYNATEGWGLAYDGEQLILSDGSATLRFIDPDGFVPTGEVTVTLNGNPINNLNELEYIDGEVWANVWQTDFILRIDPATGNVNSLVDLTGLSTQTRLGSNEAVLNGIAWDAENERLLVTGKHWSNLFEIELVDPLQ